MKYKKTTIAVAILSYGISFAEPIIKVNVPIGSTVDFSGNPTTIMSKWDSMTTFSNTGDGEIAINQGISQSSKTTDYNLSTFQKVVAGSSSIGLNILSRIGLNATAEYGEAQSNGKVSYSMGGINYTVYELPFNHNDYSQNEVNRTRTIFALEKSIYGLSDAIAKLRDAKGTSSFKKELENFIKNYGVGYVDSTQTGNMYGFDGNFSVVNSSSDIAVAGGLSMLPSVVGNAIGGSLSGGFNKSFDSQYWKASTKSWSYPANAAETHLQTAEDQFNDLASKVIEITDLSDKVSKAIEAASSKAPRVEEMKPDQRVIDDIKEKTKEKNVNTAKDALTKAINQLDDAISKKKYMDYYLKELNKTFKTYHDTILLNQDLYDSYKEAYTKGQEALNSNSNTVLRNDIQNSFSMYLLGGDRSSTKLINMLNKTSIDTLKTKHNEYLNQINKFNTRAFLVLQENGSTLTKDTFNDSNEYTTLDYSYVTWDKLYPELFDQFMIDDYPRIMKLKVLMELKNYIAIYNYFKTMVELDSKNNHILNIGLDDAIYNSQSIMEQTINTYNALTKEVFNNSDTIEMSEYRGYTIEQFYAKALNKIEKSDLFENNPGYIQTALELYKRGLINNSGNSTTKDFNTPNLFLFATTLPVIGRDSFLSGSEVHNVGVAVIMEGSLEVSPGRDNLLSISSLEFGELQDKDKKVFTPLYPIDFNAKYPIYRNKTYLKDFSFKLFYNDPSLLPLTANLFGLTES
ncbi:hypothetical protein IBE10_09195 [Francisella tularensis subsp. novicida]|uniref:hypothetical protein n=1 Tax=Francisella tularensis TaxID=263 RepID=UPI0008FD76FB|nr:hypothetical protein [Francisella tularensis]APC96160.1 hypothetical protein KX02_1866 [Francisella tularensis subsp. novicida]MBK2347089.1 hypothetical protein [Francisella tularensis subsp. novicida]